MHQDELIQHVIFNWDPFWVSTIIFIATYLVVISEKVNRAIIALLGASLMIMLGILTQEAAIQGVDFNTIGLLTGMMVIVAITQRSGIFQYIAIWSAKKVKASPWGIMLMLSVVTAIFSALLDNVTTVLLIAPITLLITQELKITPFPFLFSEIFASNIGGASTLIGDPPNIMIGSAVGLGFNDFVYNLAPITVIVMIVNLGLIYLIWGRKLQASDDTRQHVMSFDERQALKDIPLLKRALFVLFLVLTLFINAHSLNLESATIAMGGAALLMLLDNIGQTAHAQSVNVDKCFKEAEWITIFFFVGLFIVVAGVEHSGVLELLAEKMLHMTGGDFNTNALTILWMSAVISALVDNIPFVATMIPMIKSMAPVFGGAEGLMPLWWSLALGACLGGNGSLIGASANLIVAGYAERAGFPITFLKFMAYAFPLMLISIAISHFYIIWRFL
ncbi:MAG: ArsB/NhaD family transporter [gamma proteobacterium symbiont of Bathyaustriella thionipta]|nr:ArsB/NhaD family transporter [gamma proteobacterium symbiont of Bathyaustriella thionipta]MCU7949434.1 ArsB/NhaD family transporter [gamma proteobacterium symbiont of Bathyaustriella thionipta]MCU7954036.1 ArsB/NhaD family transporter [gamma proteobacterium symbiont of Bathyaustriella thionipta]MCU7956021.1 ArsB/NhaD family transporter [gamma proteobacterium symbiont of Bathyaustriella thionipta]MCU7967949.1 ArsB/NhaD family transporter [gamma proteobacterium symbiont of Bathyaustriella thio